ncbi:EF-hand calcium-binding domain-containing protein 13-like [Callospermophilus lateralis]|uniref:EF-hand calcium-binding domain-containing protein 13-like n=1 Tax=Callospermophilus lateralis TaxID=76772 RepID=UPI0040541A93
MVQNHNQEQNEGNQMVDIGDIVFALNELQQPYEDVLLPDVTDNLHNISKEQMNVSDLWNILSTLNSNLKKDEFLAALKFTIVDDDKVQFDEFTKTVKNMCDASRLKEFQEIALALDSLEGDMISGENLEDFLRNIGIKSPKEEVEKILQSHFVSEDNMVNIKDCMRALRDTQKFSNFIALNEAINKLDCMKEGSRSDKDKYSDILENTDRHFPDNTLQKTEDDSFVEGLQVEAHDIDNILGNMVFKLTPEELNDLTPNLPVDVLEIEPKSLFMLSNHSTTDIHSRPPSFNMEFS